LVYLYLSIKMMHGPIRIGDETMVYGYDVETKMQSSQWMGKGLFDQKKGGLFGQRSM